MSELLFWMLFLIAYAGFAVWLAKTLLNGIFLAVGRGGNARKAVRVSLRASREPHQAEEILTH
ncbi:MAG TPA: hypothetical protein PLP42_18505 [Acidobacteriota bacterium]|nr:hypothetical protein [Acidobacteriota bacterium]